MTFDDLVGLNVEGVGVDASVGAGDRLLSGMGMFDKDIESDDSPSFFFLASSIAPTSSF